MTDIIAQRLIAVRQTMKDQQLDAFIVPRADEYLGEYVPPQNERLHWISGFTGSAGAVMVLADRAAIFVDGRYTIQVRQQAPANLFEYENLVSPPPVQWLLDNLNEGAQVGYDPRLHTLHWQQTTEAILATSNINLVAITDNPIDLNWEDRPSPIGGQIMLLDETFTGEHSLAKRQRVGQLVADAGADATLVFQLDSIAWLLNIRGQDVPRLPVLLGFGILQSNGDMTLYCDTTKIPEDFNNHVGPGVRVAPEQEAAAALQALGTTGATVMADPDSASAWCQILVRDAGGKLLPAMDPVAFPKAQKNESELSGIRQSHIRDGAAVSRFLAWIDDEVAAGRLHDEAVLSDHLESIRRQDNSLKDLSFDTISAAGSNAAMAHYNHMNGVPAKLERNNLYLVDSGGQYLDGTTDITRTIIIGEASAAQQKHFTLVLKGHIALVSAVFPQGTRGSQLDALARQFLWAEGLNFDHGTGHGVGCFLSVHEGPQRISPKGGDAELMPGMVLSNEPGYYLEGNYGIRCENLMVVNSHSTDTEYNMLSFETLTFAPFDIRLIDKSLMTEMEIRWLNNYHAEVYEKLSPGLSGREHTWLKDATRTL